MPHSVPRRPVWRFVQGWVFSGLFCFSNSPGQGLCSPHVTHANSAARWTHGVCALPLPACLRSLHWARGSGRSTIQTERATLTAEGAQLHNQMPCQASHCLLQHVLPRKTRGTESAIQPGSLTGMNPTLWLQEKLALSLRLDRICTGSRLQCNLTYCLAPKRGVSLLAVLKNQCEE